jgi:hypothetical protein
MPALHVGAVFGKRNNCVFVDFKHTVFLKIHDCMSAVTVAQLLFAVFQFVQFSNSLKHLFGRGDFDKSFIFVHGPSSYAVAGHYLKKKGPPYPEKSVLIELNPAYVEMINDRTNVTVGML